jgi:hypothetical protein
MREYNHESIRLRANDQLLKSKGFLLFCVDSFGALEMCGDTSELSPSEQWGLDSYANNNVTTRKIDKNDDV